MTKDPLYALREAAVEMFMARSIYRDRPHETAKTLKQLRNLLAVTEAELWPVVDCTDYAEWPAELGQ